ncbi:hypothetical protein GH866_29925 [Bacillus thuringiensis]|nr:hypothetical protein [Bacillus thuringiensis]
MNPLKCNQREASNFRHIVLNIPTKDSANYHEIFQVDPQHLPQALRLAKTFQDAISPNDLSFNFEKALEIAKNIPNSGIVSSTNQNIIKQYVQLSSVIDQIKESIKTMLGLNVSSSNFWRAVAAAITNVFTNLNTQEGDTWIFWETEDSSHTRYYYNILLTIQNAETGGVMAVLPIAFEISVNVCKEKLLLLTVRDSASYEVNMKSLTLVQSLGQEISPIPSDNGDNIRNILDYFKSISIDEFMTAFNSESFLEMFQNVKDRNGIGAAISLVKGIVATGLALCPPPISLLSSLVNLFIPSGIDSQDNMWKMIEQYVKEEIDVAITNYHSYTLGTKLNGLASQLQEYTRVLKVYEQNTLKTEDSANGIRIQFRILHNSFIDYLAQLQVDFDDKGKFKILSLPFYSEAAKLHLLLLRDVVSSGAAWGIDNNQLKAYKDELKRLIKEYTNYVVTTYKDGLKKEEDKAGTSIEKWNRINDYKTNMTLSVLDDVALYPLFNTDDYTQIPDVKQSRQIFSFMLGTPRVKTTDLNINEINTAMADNIMYHGNLKQINMRTGSYTKNSYIDSIQSIYTNYDGQIDDNRGNLTEIKINQDNPIVKLIQTSNAPKDPYMSTVIYQFSDKTQTPTFGQLTGTNALQTFEFMFPSHKLSTAGSIGPMYWGSASGTYLTASAVYFGFRKSNVNEMHRLFGNIGVQIPAEVCKNTGGLVQPEIINGQNAVIVNPTTVLEYEIISPIEQEYTFKFRMSANTDGAIGIDFDNNQYTSNFFKNYETENSIKGEYGLYSLINGPTIKLQEGKNKLIIKGRNGQCALDRLEIVPIAQDTVVAFDNFDNNRLAWLNGPSIVNGGVTGNAGRITALGNTWTYINGSIQKYSRYTINVNLKLDSNDPNARQMVKLYMDNDAKWNRIFKEVQLKGGENYKKFTLEFFTSDIIDKVHIGIQGSGGNHPILFDNIEVKGRKS